MVLSFEYGQKSSPQHYPKLSTCGPLGALDSTRSTNEKVLLVRIRRPESESCVLVLTILLGLYAYELLWA